MRAGKKPGALLVNHCCLELVALEHVLHLFHSGYQLFFSSSIGEGEYDLFHRSSRTL